MRYRYFEELKELLNLRVILSVFKKSIKELCMSGKKEHYCTKVEVWVRGCLLGREDALITGLARAGSQTQHLLRYCVQGGQAQEVCLFLTRAKKI